jgi:hypothetical protein
MELVELSLAHTSNNESELLQEFLFFSLFLGDTTATMPPDSHALQFYFQRLSPLFISDEILPKLLIEPVKNKPHP